MFLVVFFFKHKTAYEMRISDWSSDVCSSDLAPDQGFAAAGIAGDRVHRHREVLWQQAGIDERSDQGDGAGRIAAGIADPLGDRKSVGEGKSVSVRLDLGGRRIIQTKQLMYYISDNNKKYNINNEIL